MEQPTNQQFNQPPVNQPVAPSVASRFSTKLTSPEVILVIALFIITVTQFAMWGTTSVRYLLSQLRDIKTDDTVIDVFAGFIAIVSSVVIFIGGVYAWNLKRISATLMLSGGVGFLIKNMFDIINDVVKFMNMPSANSADVNRAAAAIGSDLFQTAFWIFVIVMFTRASFKSKLS